MAGATVPEPLRCVGAGEATGRGPDVGSVVTGDGGTKTVDVAAGVGGPDDAGEGLSTIHMRWERVATSFATV
jgi:hypothetical protein